MSPLKVAQLSPHEERCPSPKPSFHNLQGPQQTSPSPPPGSPNRAPIERCSIARALLRLILKVPGRRTPPPQVPQRGPYRKRHPSQNLLPHISPRHMSPFPGFPTRPPHGKRCPSQEPSFTPSGSPNRAPVKGGAPFSEPSSHYLSQYPAHGLPPRVPQPDPYAERDTRLHTVNALTLSIFEVMGHPVLASLIILLDNSFSCCGESTVFLPSLNLLYLFSAKYVLRVLLGILKWTASAFS